jgi:glycosyltransferase involved in cell wall biosynthesis
LHFDLSEPGSLERALAALLDDAERRARMGAAGNARARVLYDRQNAHPRFVAVINEVVARRDRV